MNKYYPLLIAALSIFSLEQSLAVGPLEGSSRVTFIDNTGMGGYLYAPAEIPPPNMLSYSFNNGQTLSIKAPLTYYLEYMQAGRPRCTADVHFAMGRSYKVTVARIVHPTNWQKCFFEVMPL